jgi:hypothetical protein
VSEAERGYKLPDQPATTPQHQPNIDNGRLICLVGVSPLRPRSS